MERKDFLQGISLIGVGAFMPKNAKSANNATDEVPFACTLTPAETTG